MPDRTEGRIAFDTADGVTLEGEIRRPEAGPRATAVLAHAHPEHGGSKDHPLLWAVRNELAHSGFALLGFNFRGVMGSEGESGGGHGEIEDVRAALGRVREEGPGPTLVVGWSFGAAIALHAALEDERVSALALIGFPLVGSSDLVPALPAREELARLDRPVLFVAGQADQFCPAPDLRALTRRLPRAEAEILPGTDHFFWRREREVARRIARFAEAHVLGAKADSPQ